MRGKPAAAAPSFGERFRLPGAAAISSVFSCFSPSKSSKSRSVLSRGRLPAARVRRRATMRVCKQTVPDASRTRACDCSFALVTQPEAFLYGLNKRPNAPKKPPNASRTQACGCRFAPMTQSEVFANPNMKPNSPFQTRLPRATRPEAFFPLFHNKSTALFLRQNCRIH